MKNLTQNSPQTAASAIMASTGLSLTTFWVLNVLKEAYPAVKTWLTFHQGVGPLLGLFVVSLVVLAGAYFALLKTRLLSERVAFLFYAAATILFFFMVFPPFFHPLVELLAGK